MQIGLVPEPAVTESPEAAAGIETASPAAEAAVKRAAALIANAKRPVFYGGGGLINSGVDACHAFTSLVRGMAAPCTLGSEERRVGTECVLQLRARWAA